MTSNKNIFNISYPIFLTLAAQNIINVTDTAFLGRVGEVELGASAIAGVFYIAIYTIGFGFSQGAQILIGRRNGEKNYSLIGPIFNNGLVFNFILSIVLFFLAFFFMPGLMKLLVSSEQIYHASLEYLDWRIYGFFFSFFNVMFRAFYVGTTRTRVLTVSAIITAGTNVLFDYLLIFGHGGFPELGMAGAAIASVIAEAVTLLYLVIYTLASGNVKRYNLFRFEKVEVKTVKQILDLSIFIMFQNFISISTWFFFFIFIERMGERPLAATNVGRSMYVLLMIPGSALATTTNTLVSNLIGAGYKDKVVPFVNKMVRIVLILIVPIMAFTFMFPELFARIYTNDAGLIAASIPVMRVVAGAVIVCAVGSIIFNALSGTGNTRTAFAIEFIVLFFYLAYIYYTAIVHPTTVSVVWFSEFVYWIPIGGLSYLYLLKGNWRKKEI
ncbi:MATE family efflux transporter [Paludibacter sp. 221]|uniref:MATE family efflux transporter n=1 Tax=Paludibacter sp. 221 TaxID=2302939 RepID=UPI0013D68E13|nr:MATE family efflux transporter [Paludibacter sp. 221]NDV45598.1 MATE family efflux transporter [Paludibacter sp. 221]